ncbi:MAG: E3 ubiquitin ligase family protein [Cyanobacteria bacterium J06598_3]
MAIVGGILLIISLILFFVRASKLKRIGCIRSARSSTTREIQTIASTVAQDIGAGSWQDYVKVYGKVACDNPLRSEEKKVACAYYKTKVTREYEEITTRKDDQGKTVQKTEKHSETISDITRSQPFHLVDATGKIEVNPEDAAIETVEILSEFRPESHRSSKISIGGFSLSTQKHSTGKGRTLGYKYEESILPLGREALVIGLATDATSQLSIRKPTDNKQQFIISLKAEGELTNEISRHAQQAFYAMLGCLGAGTTLVAVGLFSLS